MSRGEIYAAYDAILSMEASGDYKGAYKVLRSINAKANRRARK